MAPSMWAIGTQILNYFLKIEINTLSWIWLSKEISVGMDPTLTKPQKPYTLRGQGGSEVDFHFCVVSDIGEC